MHLINKLWFTKAMLFYRFGSFLLTVIMEDIDSYHVHLGHFDN